MTVSNFVLCTTTVDDGGISLSLILYVLNMILYVVVYGPVIEMTSCSMFVNFLM